MTSKLHRRTFVGATAAAVTGLLGAAGQAAANTGDSVYTTELVCVRDSPGGYPIDAVSAGTGGYVVDGPVSDTYTWLEVAFNEDETGDINQCMVETDGTVTGWVPAQTLTAADFAYPVFGPVYREWVAGTHEELDVSASRGARVYSSADGVVRIADDVDDSPCGRHVVVDHGYGWTTRYCHLRDVLVNEEATVTRGQQIGTVGSTGDAFEPHVAFQIRQNGTSQPVPGVRGRELLAMSGVPRNYH